MASIFDYFIGTSQSKYASVAIFSTIIAICLAILFSNSDISIGNRFGVVIFVIIMSIFPVAISLFELTCIVTGGKNKPYDLCNIYAWIITGMIILYCFILIIIAVFSMFTYKKAIDKIEITEKMNNITPDDANTIAKNIIENEDNTEQFSTDMPDDISDYNNEVDPSMLNQPFEDEEEQLDTSLNTVSDYQDTNQLMNDPNNEVVPEYPEIENFRNGSIDNSEGIPGYDNEQSYMLYEKEELPKQSSTVKKQLPKLNEKNSPEPFTNNSQDFASI